jgi:histidinol dehydrogenase
VLKLYDVDSAQRTILRRTPGLATAIEYPTSVVEGTERIFGRGVTPPQAVAQILASVQEEGDAALRHWSELLDRVQLTNFRVPEGQLAAAWRALPESLQTAMTIALERIRAFHQRQPLPNWQTEELGGVVGQRVTPIERVGIYVPGGTAPLPSSLLMAAIPVDGGHPGAGGRR